MNNKEIKEKIRSVVIERHGKIDVAQTFCRTDLLLMEALEVIEKQEKQIDELEERIDILSEDQYKSSEIRFP